MSLRLEYLPADGWPPLAWLARFDPAGGTVQVTHGPRVETRPEWFCEAAWAGDFEVGGLDETDAVFGSGGRLRGGSIVFVSSGATVDRLHSFRRGDGIHWVSNSLPCLLVELGAALDPTDGGYYDLLATMTRGIADYERFLPTSAGPVRLTYFDNLAWNGRELVEQAKPDPIPGGFENFEDYRANLVSTIAAVAANARDARRRFGYGLLGTISTGYDSAASAVIAREAAGLDQAITFVRPDGVDSGDEIAGHLGIRLSSFGRYQWRDQPLCEPVFIAGDAKGEDVFFAPTAPLLEGRVLITGHGGGGIWDRHRSNPAPTFPRKDRAGLPLTEWRLAVGFLHLALPYIGGRHVRDLMRIATSPEMARYDIAGWYTRPIARRIIEEAGVPRELFGFHKRAASILLYQRQNPLTPQSARDFDAWLRRHTLAFLRRGRLPPAQFRFLLRSWRRLQGIAGGGLNWLRRRLNRGRGARLDRLAARWIDRGGRDPLFDYAFAWAMEHAMRRYASSPPADRVSGRTT